MAQTDHSEPDSIRVTCPTCRERLDVTVIDTPQSVVCPFCECSISVPSREQARREMHKPAVLPAPVVDDYPVGPALHETPQPQSRAVPKPNSGNGHSPLMVTVACPTCHERMRAPVAATAGKIACTFCATPVLVPDRETVEQWKARQVAPRQKETIGEYTAGAALPAAPLRMHVFDRMAEIRSEAPIPPPKWLFFSGVFSFPWRAEAVFRWGGMTVGFTVLLLIVSFFVGGGSGVGPAGIGIVGMGFFALPLIWITIFTVSYSADCALRVLESTASGLDKVESWAEGGWKEWMPQAIYLAWIASIPAVVSYGVGLAAERLGADFWPVTLLLVFALFPIGLLSAMEAGSIWVPLTKPIVKSLFVLWWGWAMFYLLTGAIVVALGALLYFGAPRLDMLAYVVFAPLLAAAVLIYARLLGRLAWKIGQTVSL